MSDFNNFVVQKCSLELAINIIWISCSRIHSPSVKPARETLVGLWNTFMCMIVLMCVHECKRIWYECESACGRACVRVCGSSSGLLKACWEACHCKSGKGKSPKCTEERTHHPPLSLSVSLSPLLPRSRLFSLTLIYINPTSTVLFQFFWKWNFVVTGERKTKEHFLLSSAGILSLCVHFLSPIAPMFPLIGKCPVQ